MTDSEEFGYVQRLAQDYLQHVLRGPRPVACPGRVSRLLRDVASAVQRDAERTLQPCLDSLDVVSVEAAKAVFLAVVRKEFEDGIVNWGRLVTVFALEGILTKKLLRERSAPDWDDLDLDTHTSEAISHFVAEFITSQAGDWVRQNGGWVIAHSQYQKSQRISIFLSMPDEIETDEIIKDIFCCGKTCFIPRYQFQSNHMDMVRLVSPEEIALLPKTSWNIHQPSEDEAREEALSTGGLDLIFMPGLGFDKQGHRLGRGRGYYDAYLRRCEQHQQVKPYTMALAFKEQICDQVPVDEHDVKVDEVLYEDTP